MSLLLESIKIQNGEFINLKYHNRRVNKSRSLLFEPRSNWDLNDMLNTEGLERNKVYKCRVVYGEALIKIEYLPYQITPIRTLKLVNNPDIRYHLKYVDRSAFEQIKQNNTSTDDILIVQHGLITDCSYANIVFFDGKNWITPNTPLLMGVKRQMYLDTGKIVEKKIEAKDLKHFEKARIINAMIDLEESPDIEMKNIF